MAKEPRRDEPEGAEAPARRRFLRGIAVAAVGAAFAPAIKRAAAEAIADDPPAPRPRTRWIGHC